MSYPFPAPREVNRYLYDDWEPSTNTKMKMFPPPLEVDREIYIHILQDNVLGMYISFRPLSR